MQKILEKVLLGGQCIAVGFGCYMMYWGWKQMNRLEKATFLLEKPVKSAHQPQGLTLSDIVMDPHIKLVLQEIVTHINEWRGRKTAIQAAVQPIRGLLFTGPPGVGKTMMARALASECNCSYYAATASDFTTYGSENRLRDLFKEARVSSPSIIFIDEIDGLSTRNEHAFSRLLVEMDGIYSTDVPGISASKTESFVLVVAATNKPSKLDPSLYRKGRFDCHFDLNLPNKAGRAEILKLHKRGAKFDPTFDWSECADLLQGSSGADIRFFINEAIRNASRDRSLVVSAKNLGDALDSTLYGLCSHKQSKEQQWRTAVHEVGHAFVYQILMNAQAGVPILDESDLSELSDLSEASVEVEVADGEAKVKDAIEKPRRGREAKHMVKIQRVTVHSHSNFLGSTLFYRNENVPNLKPSDIQDAICTLWGGCIAEQVFFGEHDSGSADDLAKISRLSVDAVYRYGMNKSGFPVVVQETTSVVEQLLTPEIKSIVGSNENYKEMQELVLKEKERALSIVKRHQNRIRRIAHILVEKQTLLEAEWLAAFNSSV